MTPTSPVPSIVLDLLNEGWNHLHLQRPLAAWASWQRVLRLIPGEPTATRALDQLAGAGELPAAARAVYRFQAPKDSERRARWDASLREAGNLDDLDSALHAFRALTDLDPADVDAWLNRALCLAWLGRNADAISSLETVVTLLATTDPGRAAEAWTLAEVLRFGAGAESLADDFRYAWVLSWSEGSGPPPESFKRWPNLVPLAIPLGPAERENRLETKVFEWLDRPLHSPDIPNQTRADALPRVLAALILTPRLLRISSPEPSRLLAFEDVPQFSEVFQILKSARREKAPLTLSQADAALGIYKIPMDLDPETKATLSRSVVETYYEDDWIHLPRVGLDGRSPLEASRAIAGGDEIARAKLAGVVRFREQLGTRPNVTNVYQGYPFDRLRRRLGLIDSSGNPASLDASDTTCMSEAELDRLDPSALDDATLADAFQSASAFRFDPGLAKFAAALASREIKAITGVNIAAVFAPLVREALREGEPGRALEWLDRGITMSPDAGLKRTFIVWAAEVLARIGDPEGSLAAYLSLLDGVSPSADTSMAIDGAATLLDNGHHAQAQILIFKSRERHRDTHEKPSL